MPMSYLPEYGKPERTIENSGDQKFADEALDESSMEFQLQELNQAVRKLQSYLGDLEAQLSPVLRQEQEDDGLSEGPITSGNMSPTGLRVLASQMAVCHANMRILRIQERLDV